MVGSLRLVHFRFSNCHQAINPVVSVQRMSALSFLFGFRRILATGRPTAAAAIGSTRTMPTATKTIGFSAGFSRRKSRINWRSVARYSIRPPTSVPIGERLRPSCGSGRGRHGKQSTVVPQRCPSPCNAAAGPGIHRSGQPDRPMTAKPARQLNENCSSLNRACQLLQILRVDLLRSERVISWAVSWAQK